jgi:hypothetical protein
MSLDVRLERMARLAEVGEEGCARIRASNVEIGGDGLCAEVEERYVLGAGAPGVRRLPREARAPFEVRDTVARDVAMGAYRALVSLRRIIGIGP